MQSKGRPKNPDLEEQTALFDFQEEARALFQEKERLVAYLEERDGETPGLPNDGSGDDYCNRLDRLLRLTRGPFDARYERVDHAVLRRQIEVLKDQIRRLVMMVMVNVPSMERRGASPVREGIVAGEMGFGERRRGVEMAVGEAAVVATGNVGGGGDDDVDMADMGVEESGIDVRTNDHESRLLVPSQGRLSKRKRVEGAEEAQQRRLRCRTSDRPLYRGPWLLRSLELWEEASC
jgi:hypothetical protein